MLDASAAGGPVYERMGFADHGLTTVMGYAGDGDAMPADVEECVPLTPRRSRRGRRFDAPRFGANRAAAAGQGASSSIPAERVVLRRRGKVAGYLVAQESTLAPVVADTSESLTSLIAAALRLDWATPPRINVPPESGHLATSQRLGFEERRELRHMRRGIEVLPGRRESIAAQVSLGEG